MMRVWDFGGQNILAGGSTCRRVRVMEELDFESSGFSKLGESKL
jgi:hypothetical protein